MAERDDGFIILCSVILGAQVIPTVLYISDGGPALDARFLFPFSFPIDVRMCLIGVVGIRRVSDDGLCERGGMYILVSRTSFSSVIRFAIWDLISRSQLNPR